MAATATIAAVTIGSTIYQGAQASKARDQAQAAADKQDAQQRKLLDDAKKQRANDLDQEAKKIAMAQNRARTPGMRQGNRGGTMITSQIGGSTSQQATPAGQGGKTLIGL